MTVYVKNRKRLIISMLVLQTISCYNQFSNCINILSWIGYYELRVWVSDLPIVWTSETSNRFFSTLSGEDRILYSSEDVPWRSSTNPEASSPCRFGMDRHLWAPRKLSRRLTNFVNPNLAPKWNKVSRLLAALFGQFPRSDQSSDKL